MVVFFSSGMMACFKCGSKKFENAGDLKFLEEVVLIMRHPKLIKEVRFPVNAE